MHPPPDALLLLAPGCAHCPAVLEGLNRLLKEGRLGRLEVINVLAHPEAANAVGVRAVPWCRIGRFELEGKQSPAELAAWTEHAVRGTGMPEYLGRLIESRQLAKVVDLAREQPAVLADLVALVADPATALGLRIGVGAVFEELAEAGLLGPAIPLLAPLTQAVDAQLRADAAHYLGLTAAAAAAAYLRPLLQDTDPEVREIAAESLGMLTGPARG